MARWISIIAILRNVAGVLKEVECSESSRFHAGKGRRCLPYRSGRRLRDGCPLWLDDALDHESSPLLCLLVKEVSFSTTSFALQAISLVHSAKMW